jgi:hypothetical protein
MHHLQRRVLMVHDAMYLWLSPLVHVLCQSPDRFRRTLVVFRASCGINWLVGDDRGLKKPERRR